MHSHVSTCAVVHTAAQALPPPPEAFGLFRKQIPCRRRCSLRCCVRAWGRREEAGGEEAGGEEAGGEKARVGIRCATTRARLSIEGRVASDPRDHGAGARLDAR